MKKNTKTILSKNFPCEVCGDIMKNFNYDYDNNQYGKTYYKCDNCRYKICKIN